MGVLNYFVDVFGLVRLNACEEDIRCRFLLACRGMIGSMQVMPLLRFLGVLFRHASCNEAFRKYML